MNGPDNLLNSGHIIFRFCNRNGYKPWHISMFYMLYKVERKWIVIVEISFSYFPMYSTTERWSFLIQLRRQDDDCHLHKQVSFSHLLKNFSLFSHFCDIFKILQWHCYILKLGFLILGITYYKKYELLIKQWWL